MFKNYVKIAWRNLLKNKVTSFINIAGLAVGMAVAIMIGLWIYDEVSFNKFHTNYERLAQVRLNQTFNGKTGTSQAISLPLKKELLTLFPEDFKALSQASWSYNHILAAGDKKVLQEGMYVDPTFPGMMS